MFTDYLEEKKITHIAMKIDNNPLRDLQNSLEKAKGNLQVLETNVPVEKQMEYFRFSEQIRIKDLDDEEIDNQIKTLTLPEVPAHEIKYILVVLASSGNVKAYRAIEAYNEIHSDYWSAMALLQAKITLQTQFSDEKQIFISSGLGGKGDLIRFYAFFKSTDKKYFSDYQRKLIEEEMAFCIERYNGIMEEIDIKENYFTILFLLQFQANVKEMLEEAVAECNQYGNFINKGFIITNMKTFSDEEILSELLKK